MYLLERRKGHSTGHENLPLLSDDGMWTIQKTSSKESISQAKAQSVCMLGVADPGH